MSKFELLMPKLGESVQEATIVRWMVKPGDTIEEDQPLLEIATDKVDSEIPSPVAGLLVALHFEQGALVPVGNVIATISLDGKPIAMDAPAQKAPEAELAPTAKPEPVAEKAAQSDRFYSPLVLTIAREEGISMSELDGISGSGMNGRVQKNDVLNYLKSRTQQPEQKQTASATAPETARKQTAPESKPKVHVSVSAGDEIVQMDRMRKLIADHMVMSKDVAPHVTSMVECDVTNVVFWRNRVKDEFQKREKEKITFLPVFLEAMARALKEFPMVNASIDGDQIILRKAVNIGVAVALPTGNLIVPVIKNADQLNLLGLTKELNRLAEAARNNKLKPDDIQGGTFSVSNFGTFRNVMGTPIINQPQVAIMAVGTIEKKPAVVELPTGDIIAIRHKMFLSLSYDHRVVDGALGGAFLRRVGDIIEEFDINRPF